MVAPSIGVARLRILADEVPVVTVARPLTSSAVDIVRVDDRGGLALAVDHLVGLGHERVVHVDGGAAPSSEERRTGYLEAMSAHGLGGLARIVAGGLEQEHGLAAAAELVRAARADGGLDHLPTGVVAFNDRVALGIVLGLQAVGVPVPGRVSVVGFDNARHAQAEPVPLTTIDQNTDLMARLALERAIGRAANSYLPTEQIIVPRLVMRESTAPAAIMRAPAR